MAEKLPSVHEADGCLPKALGGISKHGIGRAVAVTINAKNRERLAIEEPAREGEGKTKTGEGQIGYQGKNLGGPRVARTVDAKRGRGGRRASKKPQGPAENWNHPKKFIRQRLIHFCVPDSLLRVGAFTSHTFRASPYRWPDNEGRGAKNCTLERNRTPNAGEGAGVFRAGVVYALSVYFLPYDVFCSPPGVAAQRMRGGLSSNDASGHLRFPLNRPLSPGDDSGAIDGTHSSPHIASWVLPGLSPGYAKCDLWRFQLARYGWRQRHIAY